MSSDSFNKITLNVMLRALSSQVCSSQNPVQWVSKHHKWHHVLIQLTVRTNSTFHGKSQKNNLSFTRAKCLPFTNTNNIVIGIYSQRDVAYKLDSAKATTWEWVKYSVALWTLYRTNWCSGSHTEMRHWLILREKLMLQQNVSASL